ncbi:MAG: hypothetical protein FD153_39 [Rhodospirillaceae bacterium]|nr:MAG: hypothetical protein FD153_39 [Rhodospirillaceae bacterium]
MDTVAPRKLRDFVRETFKAHAAGFAAGAVSGLAALLSMFDIVLEPDMEQAIARIANDIVALVELLWGGTS